MYEGHDRDGEDEQDERRHHECRYMDNMAFYRELVEQDCKTANEGDDADLSRPAHVIFPRRPFIMRSEISVD